MTVRVGAAARAAVTRWASDTERVGVAISDLPGESLFDERREVAVAGGEETALLTGDEVRDGLAVLVSGAAAIAAGDVKAVLAEVCPPDLLAECDPCVESVDAGRLFDCAIAAYLLESSRSSYDVGGTGRRLPRTAASDPDRRVPAGRPRGAIVVGLSEELGRRLDADGSLDVFNDIEMPLVPVLVRMERTGVGVDTSVLADLAEEASAAIDELRTEIYDLAGCEFTIDSPEAARRGALRDPRPSTAEAHEDRLLDRRPGARDARPAAPDRRAHRRLPRAHQAQEHVHRRAARLVGEDGRLHTSFNQTVAATGRLSSSNPNLQNIPVRTELGRRIRAAFVAADPGDVIVSADYSQIELQDPRASLGRHGTDRGVHERRGLPHGHGIPGLRRRRRTPSPPVCARRAKAVNFGIVYGQTAHGLAESLGIGRAEAQEMIDRYYAAYPRVRALPGRDRRTGASRRLRDHDVRAQAPDSRTEELDLQRALLWRAHRDEPSHAGHGGRHHEACDDRGRPTTALGGFEGPSGAPGTRRTRVRSVA